MWNCNQVLRLHLSMMGGMFGNGGRGRGRNHRGGPMQHVGYGGIYNGAPYGNDYYFDSMANFEDFNSYDYYPGYNPAMVGYRGRGMVMRNMRR